jgi:ribosome-associated protein
MAVKSPVATQSSTKRAVVARKPAAVIAVAAKRRTPAGTAAVPAKKKKSVTAAAPAAARKVAVKSAVKTGSGKSGAKPDAVKTTRAKPTVKDVVLDALGDMKAIDVKAMDVRGITDITDTMVVASGTSDRHVKSIADRVVQRCKEAGFRPYGMEGERDGEWVLLDLHDVVLHVMLPRVREFYALEKLWETSAAKRA